MGSPLILGLALSMFSKAYDPETKQVYFTGTETIETVADVTTKSLVYRGPRNEVLYTEKTTYDRQSPQTVHYEAESFVDGEKTSIDTQGDRISIAYRPEHDSETKVLSLKATEPVYHPAIAGTLLSQNWNAVQKKGEYPFEMLLAFRAETLGFKIEKKGLKTVDGQEFDTFAIVPRNFLIRAFAPYMELRYKKGTHEQVKQYYGPSPIPINGEKHKMIVINFDETAAT